jgi:RNA polymerase sigma-70 factor (ECF subfamily)
MCLPSPRAGEVTQGMVELQSFADGRLPAVRLVCIRVECGFAMTSERLTLLLHQVRTGQSLATEELLPLVYEELRHLARGMMQGQPSGHTLQPTALVHEAYAKLLGSAELSVESRAHFFALAALAMRQVLANHARAKRAEKRSAEGSRVTLAEVAAAGVGGGEQREVDVLGLDDALTKLASLDARQAKLVELRFFGGLTMDETAGLMGVSVPTLEREWRAAKAFLRAELSQGMAG